MTPNKRETFSQSLGRLNSRFPQNSRTCPDLVLVGVGAVMVLPVAAAGVAVEVEVSSHAESPGSKIPNTISLPGFTSSNSAPLGRSRF